jgi:hypothetical protein
MTFEQQWIEYDYNPFILFNSSGKIITLNSEAQFLLGFTSTHELFELAKTYANVTFGFKTTFIELEYGRYKFFGLTIGYEDEEKLGIKLYQAPSYKLNTKKPEGELVNIFTIIDLCIATNSISSDIKFIKSYDPTIPDIIIDSNKLIKLLNKIYVTLASSMMITTKVFFRIGEHIKFEEKKYSIFSIAISSNMLLDDIQYNEIQNIAENNGFYIDISKDSFTINLPMITA